MNTKHPFVLFTCILLFFMWGLITVLNDILVPHLKGLFSLDYAQAMLIQFCFFTAYGLVSLPAGKIIEIVNYKRGIVIGLFIVSLGCLFFLPAASFQIYTLFLLGLFILASGIVLLQVAANPYVALLGTEKTASSRLNLAQAFNSLGTTIGPLIGSYLILSVIDDSSEVSGVETLYFSLAVIGLVLAIFIGLVKFPKLNPEKYQKFEQDLGKLASKKENIKPDKSFFSTSNPIYRYPHLILGALGVFFYVGAEVSIGSFLVNFLTSSDILALDDYSAGNHVSLYWGLAMIGRFIGFVLLLKVRARKALICSVSCAIALVITTLLTSGAISGYSLIFVGLFNSIMFPTIFTLAIAGLDEYTPQGSGILCTAIIGGAIIPLIQGLIADYIGIHYAFFIPLICYLYIFYYAYRGSVAYCKS